MRQLVRSLLIFLSAVMVLGACTAGVAGALPPADDGPATYSDPFAYCAAVGTIDAPDAQYDGPAMPDAIVEGMVEAGIVMGDAPAEIVKNAVWRCMESQVWVCHFGANLPCEEKADLSKEPSEAVQAYCEANPDADFVPAAATGRASVYAWSCAGGKAQAGEQLFQADAQGYLAAFWYELTP